jgi:hypothetical protein
MIIKYITDLYGYVDTTISGDICAQVPARLLHNIPDGDSVTSGMVLYWTGCTTLGYAIMLAIYTSPTSNIIAMTTSSNQR